MTEYTFTKLPNYVLEHLLLSNFTKSEISVILFIARMSYGFNKKYTKPLLLSEFTQGTNINRNNVWKTLDSLIKRDIILRKKREGYHYSYKICMKKQELFF